MWDKFIFQVIQVRGLFLGTTSTTVLFVNLILDKVIRGYQWLKG